MDRDSEAIVSRLVNLACLHENQESHDWGTLSFIAAILHSEKSREAHRHLCAKSLATWLAAWLESFVYR